MPDLAVLIAVGSKLGLYAGCLLGWGIVLCALLFPSLRAAFAWRRWGLACALLALGCAGLSFAARGIVLTGTLSGMWDPAMLGLLWQTGAGAALVWRGAGLGLVLAALCLAGRLGMPGALWGAALGGAVAAWAFAAEGHLSGAGPWAQLALMVHLAGAAVWLGILVPLFQARGAAAASLGAAFGRVAMVSVPVMLAAGLAMAVLVLGSFEALASPYGRTLLLKLLAVAALLTLAARNKLRLVPALAAGDPRAAMQLRWAIALEGGCFLAILLASAVLTSAVPLPA
jgi:putative copper resistance protein D